MEISAASAVFDVVWLSPVPGSDGAAKLVNEEVFPAWLNDMSLKLLWDCVV
jgi:hypothetical protein